MKNKLNLERGQALILVVFAIIGLIAITGLAIDGGMAFSDRRHAQNAADTAALAGALAKINAQIPAPDGPGLNEIAARGPMRIAALERAESNGYTNTSPGGKLGTVQVYNCDEAEATCDYPYAGNREYLQVIISSDVDTFFAKVVGVPQVHNRVQALARADNDDSGQVFDGAGVVSVDNNCEDDPSESLIIAGNVKITLNGGGLWSNADSDCALKCLGSSSITLEDGELGTPTNGFDLNSMGADCTASLAGKTNFNQDPILVPDDIPTFSRPPECVNASTNLTEFTRSMRLHDGISQETDTLHPGYYDEFPPTKYRFSTTQTATHLFMEPGIYCVDSVLKQVDRNVHLWGDDVLIYVLPNNNVKLNGGVIQLTAIKGTNKPYAPTGKDYEKYWNYLIIVEPPPIPPYDYTDPTCDVNIEGGLNNKYVGAIFAPSCEISIKGNAGTPDDGIDSQIIGFHVTLTGDADFTINYTKDNNPYILDPANTGIVR